jgi:hypothetical protein
MSASAYSNVPELLKATLKVVVALERVLDDPEGLTYTTTAQTSLYARRTLDSRTFGNRPGPELLVPLDLPMTLTDETPAPLRRR